MADRIDLGLCRRAGATPSGATVMGAALINSYLVLLFLLVHFKVVRFNLFWKLSPFMVIALILFGLLIPMGWGAPQGSAIVVRNSVAIVPDVAGEVTEVAATANMPLRAGDILFRIDPVPYQAQVSAIEAQLKLSDMRLSQMTTLFERDAGRGFDVQQRQSEVDQLKAQLDGAKWNLDKTVVRAPGDGYVTNVALRKGARVANLPLTPVMAFIDTSSTMIGVEINQIDARYVEPGQDVEITFKFAPGHVYTGKVESILQAVGTGQAQTSGSAVTPKTIEAVPFVVRVALDDTAFAKRLPAGSTGTAAVYTAHLKPTHMVRRVLLRQVAIINYVNPF
jgi:multidrug resistance efflux pump